jgi:hypothetical protein
VTACEVRIGSDIAGCSKGGFSLTCHNRFVRPIRLRPNSWALGILTLFVVHIVGCCWSLFGSLPVGQTTLLEVTSIRESFVVGRVGGYTSSGRSPLWLYVLIGAQLTMYPAACFAHIAGFTNATSGMPSDVSGFVGPYCFDLKAYLCQRKDGCSACLIVSARGHLWFVMDTPQRFD